MPILWWTRLGFDNNQKTSPVPPTSNTLHRVDTDPEGCHCTIYISNIWHMNIISICMYIYIYMYMYIAIRKKQNQGSNRRSWWSRCRRYRCVYIYIYGSQNPSSKAFCLELLDLLSIIVYYIYIHKSYICRYPYIVNMYPLVH